MSEMILADADDIRTMPADADDIRTMPDDQLMQELARGLTLTAVGLSRLSVIWAEAERRGKDLSHLRTGLAAKLPLIASGQLAAEAVVAFAGRSHVLRALEGVPLDVQRRLADGEPIPVYLPGEHGPKSLPLARIPANAVPRVIADGIVRTPAEQRLAIRAKKHKTDDSQRKYTVSIDREARTIKIGKMIVPIATIMAAMAEAAGAIGEVYDSPEKPAKIVGGRFTDDERDRLRAAARSHGLDERDMVRLAVVAMWML